MRGDIEFRCAIVELCASTYSPKATRKSRLKSGLAPVIHCRGVMLLTIVLAGARLRRETANATKYLNSD